MENVGLSGVDEAVVDAVADTATVEDVEAEDKPDSAGLDHSVVVRPKCFHTE